jgi:hypothetical protein
VCWTLLLAAAVGERYKGVRCVLSAGCGGGGGASVVWEGVRGVR